MSSYRRPALAPTSIADDSGRPIPYGALWDGVERIPDAAYSRETHPERFAPLHAVADALVDWLCAEHDVQTGPPGDDDLAGCPTDRDDIVRAVRVAADGSRSAPLVVAWTDHPGVWVGTGLLGGASFPPCGCDACDETWESAADALEQTVLAVAAGRYREWLHEDEELPLGDAIDADDSSWSGSSAVEPEEMPRLRARAAALRPDGRWAPWPRRERVTP